MNLFVISPETSHPNELELVRTMFAAGLRWYHLRKPDWDRNEMAQWLQRLTVAERARVVVHSHHELVEELGLGGRHWRDDASAPVHPGATSRVQSRACHDLPTLERILGPETEARERTGGFHHVLISPLYASISKSGHGPAAVWNRRDLKELLDKRGLASKSRLRARVIGLGGIDASKLEECHAMGLDGVAVVGAIWQAPDPLVAFETLHRACRFKHTAAELSHAADHLPLHPIMCITQDGLPLSHVEQARRLCAAGARWVQLRTKSAQVTEWLSTAREFTAVCRQYGAISIINDSVEIALAARADGVHLGKLDQEWESARRMLGPDKILGGTVNNADDADRAVACGCLDYVGLGPWRYTSNKKNLSPVLGPNGVAAVIRRLKGLPAWVIGGIEQADLAAVHATGATGVAASSALFKGNAVEANFVRFKWPGASPALDDEIALSGEVANQSTSL